MFRNFIFSALGILCISCCTPEDTSSWYKWEILDNRDFPFLNMLFEDGFYYANTVNPDNGDQHFLKINEKNGEIVYKTQLVIGGELPNTIASAHYFYDGKIIYIWDRYIFHLNKASGNVITIDTFPNYIDNHQFYPDFFTGASYGTNFTKYSFYEFIYEDGHFKQKIIHVEYFVHANGITDAGVAPLKTPDGWVMVYSRGEDDYIVYEKNGVIDRYVVSLKYPWEVLLGSSYLTKDYAIFTCNAQLIKVDINEPARFEVIELYKGYGPFTEIGDYLYYFPLNTQTPQGLVKYNPKTNEHKIFVTDSPYFLKPIKVNDTLCYPMGGNFRKFNLKTEMWLKYNEDEFMSLGYLSGFGASQNSKLLYNEYGYFCYPF